MTKRIFGIDQKKRGNTDVDFVPCMIIMLMFFIGSLSMCAASVRPSAQNNSSEFESLISPERAEFMLCCENGIEFDEGDMQ